MSALRSSKDLSLTNYAILMYAKVIPNESTGIQTVYMKLRIGSTTSYSFYGHSSTSLSGTVDGTSILSKSGTPTAAWTTETFTYNGTTFKKIGELGEGSYTVSDAATIGKTLTLSASWTYTGTNPPNYMVPSQTSMTVSTQVTIDPIYKNNLLDKVTTSSDYFDANITCKFTITNASSYSKLVLTTGGVDVSTIYIGKLAAGTYTKTIAFTSDELQTIYKALPTDETGRLWFKLQTYSDSAYTAQIGKTSGGSMLLTIPTNITPTLVAFTATPVNYNAWIKPKEIFVQDYSGATIGITGRGGTGADIASYWIKATCGGYEWTSSTNTLSIARLPSNGALKVDYYVTDTRGRTSAVGSRQIMVLSYSSPSYSTCQIARGTYSSGTWTASEDGEHVAVTILPLISLSTESNTCSLSFSLGTGATPTVLSGATTGLVSGTPVVVYLSGMSVEETHSLTITMSDLVGTSRDIKITVPTIFVTMEFNKSGKGIAFGKTSEKDAFECALPSTFSAQATFSAPAVFSGTLTSNHFSYFNNTTVFRGDVSFQGKVSGNTGSDYILPIASTSVLGGVKVDGTTITASSDGTISAKKPVLNYIAGYAAGTTATSCTFTPAVYTLLIFGLTPSSSGAICTAILPGVMASENVNFQVADETNYCKWQLTSTGLSRVSGAGNIRFIYGLKV